MECLVQAEKSRLHLPAPKTEGKIPAVFPAAWC